MEAESRQKLKLELAKAESKKNDLLFKRKNAAGPAATSLSFFSKKEKSTQPQSKKDKKVMAEIKTFAAPRFPVPSHVNAGISPEAHLPASSPSVPSVTSVPPPGDYDFLVDSDRTAVERDVNSENFDPASYTCCLGAALVASSHEADEEKFDKAVAQSMELKSSNPDVPWTSRYAPTQLPDTICGKSNRRIAKETLQFLEDYKNHLAELAELARKSKKSKKKKQKYDAWLMDSDYEDDTVKNCLLLCGAPGTGKTSLARAAVKQSGGNVLEVSTADARGGTALKKKIEEATLSKSFNQEVRQCEERGDDKYATRTTYISNSRQHNRRINSRS